VIEVPCEQEEKDRQQYGREQNFHRPGDNNPENPHGLARSGEERRKRFDGGLFHSLGKGRHMFIQASDFDPITLLYRRSVLRNFGR
jgi:hypothetical protein